MVCTFSLNKFHEYNFSIFPARHLLFRVNKPICVLLVKQIILAFYPCKITVYIKM